MRLAIFSSVALFALVACDPGPRMDLANRMADDQAQNYPAAPYGYQVGAVIQNIKFVGKADPDGAAGTATYDTLPMKAFALSDFYGSPDVKLLVVSGVAGWCGPCNEEQFEVPDLQAKYEPLGVRWVEGLVQGFNETTGAPATSSDIDRWANRHGLHVAIGLDPEDKLHEYADVTAFPLNMLIRTSDMHIVYMAVGLNPSQPSLDPVIAQYIP